MLFLQPGLLFPPSPGKLLCMLQYPVLQETSLNTQLYQVPSLYPSAHATPLQPWPVRVLNAWSCVYLLHWAVSLDGGLRLS